MKSIGERIKSIVEDPEKLRRVWIAGWIIAYSMLVFGFLLMIWVFFSEY
ncbi:MAG: hypothetical protein LBM39_02570 [Candidatus Methanoplasma sp.]|nr:hypothetical protein [Candidatus Methanoplasma sp.]